MLNESFDVVGEKETVFIYKDICKGRAISKFKNNLIKCVFFKLSKMFSYFGDSQTNLSFETFVQV